LGESLGHGEVVGGKDEERAVECTLVVGVGSRQQELAPCVGFVGEAKVLVAERGPPFDVVRDDLVKKECAHARHLPFRRTRWEARGPSRAGFHRSETARLARRSCASGTT
jgi:hypothetical protein